MYSMYHSSASLVNDYSDFPKRRGGFYIHLWPLLAKTSLKRAQETHQQQSFLPRQLLCGFGEFLNLSASGSPLFKMGLVINSLLKRQSIHMRKASCCLGFITCSMGIKSHSSTIKNLQAIHSMFPVEWVQKRSAFHYLLSHGVPGNHTYLLRMLPWTGNICWTFQRTRYTTHQSSYPPGAYRQIRKRRHKHIRNHSTGSTWAMPAGRCYRIYF